MSRLASLLIVLVLWLLEALLHRRKPRRDGVFLDGLHFFLTPYLVQIWLGYFLIPLGAVLILGLEGIRFFPLGEISLTVPLTLFCLPICDLGSYLMHRLQHRVPFLWRFHQIHHSSQELDVLSSVRFHSLDAALQQAAFGLPLYLLAFADGHFSRSEGECILLAAGILIAWNVLTHGSFGHWPKFLDTLFVTPGFHRKHHEVGARGHYALQFSFWDRFFGTQIKSGKEKGFLIVHGLDDGKNPSLAEQFFWPGC